MTEYASATAVVIGGSIGGLTAALLLRDLGFSVDVYERTPTALDGREAASCCNRIPCAGSASAAIRTSPTCRPAHSYVQYLQRDGGVVHREKAAWTYTSWGTFYRALLADFGTEHYHYGEYACGFSQDTDRATVRFVSGSSATADLVVFADGITSTARQRFDPDATLRYSGYIGWRGHRRPVGAQHGHPRGPRRCDHLRRRSAFPHHHVPIPGKTVWTRAPADELCLVPKRGPPPGAVRDADRQARVPGFGVGTPRPGCKTATSDEMRFCGSGVIRTAVAEVVVATETPYLQVLSDVRSSRMAQGVSRSSAMPRARLPPRRSRYRQKRPADAWALAAALGEAPVTSPRR